MLYGAYPGHIAFVWHFPACSQRLVAIDFVRAALWVACFEFRSERSLSVPRFGFSRYNPVEFRLTRNAQPARAHAHHGAPHLWRCRLRYRLLIIILGQKFLHLERSRLALASRADQQFKHLDDAAQFIAQFGDVVDSDVLLRTADGNTLRGTALASTCNFAQAHVVPSQGSIRRACKYLQLCARASSAVSG